MPETIAAPPWTSTQVKEYLQKQIDDLRTMLDERYATQTKAVDAAFVAQQTAMQTALTAQALAVQVAQAAAKEATAKAEEAADKRHDSLVLKMDEEYARSAEQYTLLASRLDLIQGQNRGARATWNAIYMAIGGTAAIVTAVYYTLKP
jgi:hypothetical protein